MTRDGIVALMILGSIGDGVINVMTIIRLRTHTKPFPPPPPRLMITGLDPKAERFISSRVYGSFVLVPCSESGYQARKPKPLIQP